MLSTKDSIACLLFMIDSTDFILSLVVGMVRIVGSEVESATLLALYCPASYEITYVYHVTQFTDILARLDALEEGFCLFIQRVEAYPCSLESQVAPDNADIVGHDSAYLMHTLCDEHLLFVGHGALVVPLRYQRVEVIFVDVVE